MAANAPIDFKAFRADLAAALKELEQKYGFTMGLGNITFDGATGAFRSQFDATPVDLVEGVDVLKTVKMSELTALRAYFGADAFKKRATMPSLGGDVVAVGYVPQRKYPVTSVVVTGPNKGKVYVLPKLTFGF